MSSVDSLRIQCARCDRLVEIETFRTDADPAAIHLRCPKCEEAYTVKSAGAAPAAASEPEPEAAGEAGPGESCPKCGKAKVDEHPVACPHCGLEFARWSPDDEESKSAEHQLLWRLWRLVEGDFSAVERHEAFLAACDGRRALPFAASRYRQWLAKHPGDELAGKRLKQIVALAQVSALEQSLPARAPPDPLRKVLVALVLAFVLILLLLYAAPIVMEGFKARKKPPQDTSYVRPPSVRNLKAPMDPGDPGGSGLQKRGPDGMSM